MASCDVGAKGLSRLSLLGLHHTGGSWDPERWSWADIRSSRAQVLRSACHVQLRTPHANMTAMGLSMLSLLRLQLSQQAEMPSILEPVAARLLADAGSMLSEASQAGQRAASERLLCRRAKALPHLSAS